MKSFGTTIILSEHHFDDVMNICNKMLVMENGKVIAFGETKRVVKDLFSKNEYVPMLPNCTKLSTILSVSDPIMTVKEARMHLKKHHLEKKEETKEVEELSKEVLLLKDLSFRYERTGKDILKNIQLMIKQGEIFTIVAGNGSGKTTLLSVICGILKPYTGKIVNEHTIAMLPQQPKMIFSKSTVAEELNSVCHHEEWKKTLMMELELESLLEKHPYDLSGGEEEKVAIAKVILTESDIFLFDEPTKGMDGALKEKFIHILKTLKLQGKTIVLVSHDMEFCAEVSDRCAMLFQGEIVGENNAKDFFLNNAFYTNDIVRMTSGILPHTVTFHELSSLVAKEEHA